MEAHVVALALNRARRRMMVKYLDDSSLFYCSVIESRMNDLAGHRFRVCVKINKQREP